MHRFIVVTAAFLGALAVALGAFGAHGLQKFTSDERIIEGFRTGTQYQMYHAIVLVVVGCLADRFSAGMIRWAIACFMVGILFFSGSLYLLTFLKINNNGLAAVVGPITPLGGIILIAGWVFLLLAAWKKK